MTDYRPSQSARLILEGGRDAKVSQVVRLVVEGGQDAKVPQLVRMVLRSSTALGNIYQVAQIGRMVLEGAGGTVAVPQLVRMVLRSTAEATTHHRRMSLM